jgi:hypothetical protein
MALFVLGSDWFGLLFLPSIFEVSEAGEVAAQISCLHFRE